MAKDKTKPRAELRDRHEAERQQQKAAAARKRRRTALLVIVGVLVVALAATGVTLLVLRSQAEKRMLSTSGDPAVQITPPNMTADSLAIIANPKATLQSDAITVDVYTDYQCPTCIMYQGFAGDALTQLATDGKIRLNYHLLTFEDGLVSNTASTRAAIASTCADTVGKFSEYNAAVFAASPQTQTTGAVVFTDDQLQTTFPGTAGITGDDLTNFRSCYTERRTSAFVDNMNKTNAITPVPNNATFASGVSDAPYYLANDQTVDLSTALSSSTAGTIDEETLLTLLQTTASGSGG